MAAKRGNNYAEKWNKTTVIKALNKIYFHVEDNKVVYLAISLVDSELYPDIWQYWTTKFKDDDEVIRAIKRIEAKIEANLLSQALTNKVNATVAIFVLKNKYKWSDKQEIDHTTGGDKITWNEEKTYVKPAGKDTE
ncbi:terminase small subunit [Pedobacter cryoconitis]|uniref:Uncharacterized protein n=1 Tax=Pedobacter cryoconitis TaxID=188932 RepID=A0A327S8I4_9SPHI|nr:terminase small subunit [Pedobacter cryoconitis]RAJ24985.1 hypothetical protein LY11_04172 [Pedobacter cryoconitis]